MDSTVLGLTVLGGDTRVRTNGQLIRLDQSVAAGQQGHKVQRVQQAPRVLKVPKAPKAL